MKEHFYFHAIIISHDTFELSNHSTTHGLKSEEIFLVKNSERVLTHYESNIGVWKCQMSPSQTYNKPIDDDVVKADGKIASRWQFVTARH